MDSLVHGGVEADNILWRMWRQVSVLAEVLSYLEMD